MKRRPVKIFIIGICLIISLPTFAVDISSQIKASYLYNFLQFITFQNDFKNTRLNVCIVGENSFGNVFNKIDGESTPQAKLHIIYLANGADIAALKACHVLFLTKSMKKDSLKILSAIDNKEVVTIGDYSPFIADGGLIELFSARGKILFRINPNLVKQTNFKIAAQLIELGRN